MKKSIYTKFDIESLHNWSTIPDTLGEVLYLKSLHRHHNTIKVYVQITDSDREIEFIKLGHTLREYLNGKYYDDVYKCLNLGSRSMEMMAEELLRYCREQLKINAYKVQVDEDGRDGAIVEL